MSAVGRVARGAVRRRRLQTAVIAVVVGVSTTMSVVALGLIAASTGPFDQAYARQRGAHLIASYDAGTVPVAALARTADRPGVEATAGPFDQAGVEFTEVGRPGPGFSLAVVGRADPGGPVDRVNVWSGRWPTAPGEIVINQSPAETRPTSGNGPGFDPTGLGTRLGVPGGPTLTVVGLAFSVSRSADAWVTPGQMTSLHPNTRQVLYRFTQAATGAQVDRGQATVTAGLPPSALLGFQSYLTTRASAVSETSTFVPFLVAFGVLGLAVAVLIVANVISGAVVSGVRHIGMLKALGFTPTQVMSVYLAMVSIPAVIGCGLGVVTGNLLAEPLLTNSFKGFGPGSIGVAGWVNVVVLLGMPTVVLLSALAPSLTARRLSAAEAISAGSSPRTGRALRIQRRLSGTRLPRAVGLGLGLPFARPARSLMTLAAVVLGISSVTLAVGLGQTVVNAQDAEQRVEAAFPIEVHTDSGSPVPGTTSNEGTRPGPADTAADVALLRSLPGTAQVSATTELDVRQIGGTGLRVRFARTDDPAPHYQVLQGHWPNAAGQVAVSQRFLLEHGLTVGDRFGLERDGHRTQVQITAKTLISTSAVIFADWSTLDRLAPGTTADLYRVKLTPGTDEQAYLQAVESASDHFQAGTLEGVDAAVVLIFATVTMLTLMLAALAALGVFNTVVLNTRERRRDLGMLKSIGMTPNQVVLMVVTSMSALGAVGGLIGIPLGVLGLHVVVPAMADAAQIVITASMLRVYSLPLLALLALAGIAIAALGALVPARAASRITVAEALRNE